MRKVIKTTDGAAQTIKAGTVIFEEGDAGKSFFIVRGGKVGVFKNHGQPNQVQLGVVSEGKVLGEIAALDGRPRTATAVTLVDATLVEVPAATLTFELGQCAGWVQTIVYDLVERLRSTAEVLSKAGIQDGTQHGARGEETKA